MSADLRMTLTAPCANCPFRTDIPPFLRPARAREIADGLTRRDTWFQCHKTIRRWPVIEHCAGALIVLEKMERPHQLMRIYERIGSYDRTKLKMDAPVFDTMRQFVAAQRGER